MGATARPPCIALIADMVQSRSLAGAERTSVQRRFTRLVEGLNEHYSEDLLSSFVITLGDEFQGLLRRADRIPEIIWDVEQGFTDREIRIGFGFGVLHTPVHDYAINVDGPALHQARAAIERAKSQSLLGGVFEGFPNSDEVLNGFARMLWLQRTRWTSQQRKTVELAREGLSQTEIAKIMKISKQAVSKHAISSGSTVYREGEAGFHEYLEHYVNASLKVKISDSVA